MASRPLVLLEQWSYHFKNVTAVNEWEDENKLKWLKVWLTERTQIAFQRLSEATRGDYKEAVKNVLSQLLKNISTKPSFKCAEKGRLKENARERFTLNSYLGQLEHPQVVLSVRQRNPQQLDEAVSAMLEMEAYVSPKTSSQSVSGVDTQGTIPVAVASPQNRLTSVVEKLVERVEQLEHSLTPWRK